MPKAQWGITSRDVEEFDRSTVYTPYSGPQPPMPAVYAFRIKQLTYTASDGEKHPSLKIGTELVPRSAEDKKYKGFYCSTFIAITPRTGFRYVPFLDAIGVSGRDFESRTMIDGEGAIRSIGKWRNDGTTVILGQLNNRTDQNGNVYPELTWFGEYDASAPADEDVDDDELYDDEDADDSDEVDDDDDFEDEEPEPPVKRRSNTTRTTRKAAPVRRSRRV